MKFTSRKAEVDDVVACVKILRDWFKESDWMPALPYLKKSMQDFWRKVIEENEAWVAISGNKIIGFCTRNDENIGALYVVPEVRNNGLGKHLLDLAKVNCKEIVVWAFEANKDARNFYRRERFIETNKEIDAETNFIDIEHRWTKS